jgi:PAS domain S-box-containing protein
MPTRDIKKNKKGRNLENRKRVRLPESSVISKPQSFKPLDKQVEERLRKVHEDLEKQIQERTQELVRTNETLRVEIDERKRIEGELIQRTKELEALNEMGVLINQSLDLDRVFRVALEKAVSLTGYDDGTIYLTNDEKQILERKYVLKPPFALAEESKVIKYGEGLSGKAIISKQPVLASIDEYSSHRMVPALKKEGIQTLMAFPLLSKGRAIGTIILLSYSRRELSQRDIHLLESIGSQIGLAVENASLFSNVAKAKSEWETTFDAVTNGIIIIDRDYRIIRVNKHTLKRFGVEFNDLIGKKCFETLEHRDTPCERCCVSDVFATKKSAFLEKENKYTKRLFQLHTFPILNEAREVVGAVELASDITEEKRLEIEKEVVNKVNKILASSLDVKEMIKAVRTELNRALDSERMSIALFNGEDETFRFFAIDKDYHVEELVESVIYPLKRTNLKRVAETGIPVIVSDTKENDTWTAKKLSKEGIRSTLVFPLEYQGKVIGTMNFGSKKANHFSEAQFNLLGQIAPGLTISIQNALLFEEIKQSEERYRTVVESALDGVCMIDTDYRFKYVNEKLAEIQGYRREELIGTDMRDYLDEEGKRLLAYREDQRKRGIKLSPYFELTILRKGGEVRNAEISARSIKDSRGDVNIIVIVKDITERKRAEEALQESENRYRDLVEYSQYLICTHTLEGKILSVNQEGAKLLGYDQKDLLDKNIRDLLAPEVREEFDLYLSTIREKGAAEGLMRIQNAKGENRIWAYNNSLRTEEVTEPIVRSIAHDITDRHQTEKAVKRLSQENAIMAEIGQIISSTLDIKDVYERFAEKVRELFPFDRIIIHILNLRENAICPAYITGLNIPYPEGGAIMRLTGTFAEKTIHTRKPMFLQLEDQEKVTHTAPELKPNFQIGIRSLLGIPLISKDEVIGILHLQSCKLDAYSQKDLRLAERVGNQIAGAIANAQLYSERKQAEEALKKNQEELIKKNKEIEESRKNLQLALEELEGAYKELKTSQAKILQQEKMASIGQLAAGVAHEINNPMAFISSNLGTLDKYIDRLKEFIQTQLEVIESLQATEAMEGLKRKEKELKLDYITEDIKGLITESLEGSERVRKIVQSLKSFARVDEAEYKYTDINECIETTINIVWNELKYKATLKKDYGKLPLTKCYPQQMNQVFMNLLINAGDAIEKQGEIVIKTWDEDGSIWVAISDTGHGILKEDLQRIFEPFFTTKEVGKGTGLGLSITYEIVKKHNGEVTVESEVGKGTTFTVRIPII